MIKPRQSASAASYSCSSTGRRILHYKGDKEAKEREVIAALGDFESEFVSPAINRRRALLMQREGGEIEDNEIPRDILRVMVENIEGLDLDRSTIVRETAFFLLTGASTSAAALASTLDNIFDWIGDRPADAMRLTEDRVFVRRCILETLRLAPISPIASRWATKDFRLGDGTEIGEGDCVHIDIRQANRDVEVFGADADVFMPDRGIPTDVPRHGFSFDHGMHHCIGQELAVGIEPDVDDGFEHRLFGLVGVVIQELLRLGVRRDPDDPPVIDPLSERGAYGLYPGAADRRQRWDRAQADARARARVARADGSHMSLQFRLPSELLDLRKRAKRVAEQGVAQFGRWHDSWINGYSKDFSKVLAGEGWIGMTWPTEHGGGGRPAIERVIMAEEMISAGAPIAAGWVADRQMGPSICAYGTEDQRAEFLPGILSGDTTWCIGMSEPDAGSDLAALKTSAVRDGDDYVINGQKVWTSLAAIGDYCYLIVRTSDDGPPHRGVSELIVPMDLPGIEVRTVLDMITNDHFCEVFFTDVRVPAESLMGVEGEAFKQTMAQLEHERGGIDRLVSNRPLYDRALEAVDTADPIVRQEIAAIETGYRLGRLMVYRGALGQAPPGFSAATKCFCTEHEQRVADFAARALGAAATTDRELAAAICYAPAYTIQGGTSNIMRNILGERVLGLPREPRT